MRNFFAILAVLLFLTSCSSTKPTASKPLYEILAVNNDGGAGIKFYEVLTEPKEVLMLLGDETLSQKIKTDDAKTSSFLVLNSGPTKEPYNRIKIEKIIETETEILVYIKDTQKNTEADPSNENIVQPYTVVKINSKKPIVFK
ncbi:hypothetical protein [Flavobacterium sedimenticola]|uniref:PrcB C-terminal domain-containing protein n=1 Tax=Flavobacterium sedimenticola TaxID=3043286 RepID=A0ABT6XPU5_9FLAO|nr:hypothetical protein [Flavobacterium sedimenticola]MDI9257106.1 hypothetical protein [Flavobacterium sedimenticola]